MRTGSPSRRRARSRPASTAPRRAWPCRRVPPAGLAYRQEHYEGKAEDRASIVSLREQAEVPAGHYRRVLMTRGHQPARAEGPRVQVLRARGGTGARGERVRRERSRGAGQLQARLGRLRARVGARGPGGVTIAGAAGGRGRRGRRLMRLHPGRRRALPRSPPVVPAVLAPLQPLRGPSPGDGSVSIENSRGPAALVLTATVARRYYIEGATKSDIAAELGLSRFKVARLLDEARASGVVRIELDSSGRIDLDLSVRLREAFGLRALRRGRRPGGRRCAAADGARAGGGRAGDRDRGARRRARPGLGAVAHADADRDRRRSRAATSSSSPGRSSLPHDESPVELVRDVARRSAGQAYFYYAPMILPDAATAEGAAHAAGGRAGAREVRRRHEGGGRGGRLAGRACRRSPMR